MIVDEAHYLQARVAGVAGGQRTAPAVPAAADGNPRSELAGRALQSRDPAPTRPTADSEGIPRSFPDPKRPRQPREPEELRRLLGQVMIRNTRSNAGINLPPRRAETVLFEPEADERVFWQTWEAELRTELGRLPASQASLWGRLLLQAAGSSPAAWRGALQKFPTTRHLKLGASGRRWNRAGKRNAICSLL